MACSISCDHQKGLSVCLYMSHVLRAYQSVSCIFFPCIPESFGVFVHLWGFFVISLDWMALKGKDHFLEAQNQSWRDHASYFFSYEYPPQRVLKMMLTHSNLTMQTPYLLFSIFFIFSFPSPPPPSSCSFFVTQQYNFVLNFILFFLLLLFSNPCPSIVQAPAGQFLVTLCRSCGA